jgi:hypothetical protein
MHPSRNETKAPGGPAILPMTGPPSFFVRRPHPSRDPLHPSLKAEAEDDYHMRIHYRNGSSAYAWIIALSGGAMRVAVKDADDVLELVLDGGEWRTGDGRAVTFEFPWIQEGVLPFLTQLERMSADRSIQKACGGTGECLLRQLFSAPGTPVI